MLALALVTLLACGDPDADDSGHTHGQDGGTASDGGTGSDTGTLDFGRSQVTDGGTYTVSWAPSVDPIVQSQDFAITLTVTPDVMPEGGYTVSAATATMPNHGHGMNVSPVIVENADGSFTAAPFEFHMEGWWEITVDLTSQDGTETAAFNHYCCD